MAVLFHVVFDRTPTAKPFNAAIWAQVTAYDNSSIRAAMLKDLLRLHPLNGMTSADIDKLLGPGDNTGHWQQWDRNYWLGNDYMIDSEWLVIRFDASGRVSKYEIVSD
ncbi:MAG: hypothetical protein K8S99_00085 [Planctomycetes bacterium]|nr:hypothetical protein [Planctomycetota bacterium]